ENGKYLGTKTVDGVDVRMYLLMSDSDFAPEEALNNARFTSKYVALSMPKFKIEYASKMEAILKELGIEKAFSKKTADFKNMFDYGNMWIDSVFHKTYIDVNEEGTEAAAVTALSMDGASANIPPEPVEIKFNKPFTFVIKDDANGEILFVGEYAFAN
ncbi:MAG: hypothetical protein II998_00405, partial [Clostridia bacterium]|nr:hypothetical protein [Clostridia bacterium]